MEIKAAGYDKLIGLESELKELTDTSFKLYNLGHLHKRLNSQPIHSSTHKLKVKELVEAAGFPMIVHALELVRECIERYDLETK